MGTAFFISLMIALGICACYGFRGGACLIFVSLLINAGLIAFDPVFGFMGSSYFIIPVCLIALAEIIADKFRTSGYIADVCGLVLRSFAAAFITAVYIPYSKFGVIALAGILLGVFVSCAVNLAKPVVRTWLADLMPGSIGLGTVILSVFADLMIIAVLVSGYFINYIFAFWGLAAFIVSLFTLVMFYRQGGRPKWFLGRLYCSELED